MNRRSFLSLIVAAPGIAALANIVPQSVVPSVVQPAFLRGAGRFKAVRRYVLPFAPDTGFDFVIPAGRIARFVAQPQFIFRPDRLFIPACCSSFPQGVGAPGDARSFSLLNVAASGEPQLEESVPAWIFDEVAIPTRMFFDTVAPGCEVVLAVLNESKQPARFQAALFGDAVFEGGA